MSRRVALRLTTAAFVVASAGTFFVQPASADTTTVLVPSAAAWYQPNPTCSLPTGCLTTSSVPVAPPVPVPDVPLTPYPAGSMHVGYSGGAETSRSYLAFNSGSVVGDLVGATLDIPLDVDAADGSTLPDTAKVQACLYSGDATTAEGSIDTPPIATCDAHATLTYVATPTPHLHGDLKPLTSGLLTTSGIALLPDNTKVTPTDAWAIAFSAPTRTDAAKTAPPKLTLALTPSAVTPDVPLPVDVPDTTPITAPIGTVDVPSTSGLSPIDTPPITNDVPAVQAPAVSNNQPVQNAASPSTITVGYAYPIVWVLPLLFLVVVPAAARALTRDLTPKPNAEAQG